MKKLLILLCLAFSISASAIVDHFVAVDFGTERHEALRSIKARFGRPDASDDEVYQAARLARADEFIHELDDGYQTVIDGSGGDLSQGQMQLLSIARAMIADEPVMILDEATSSIDTRTARRRGQLRPETPQHNGLRQDA